MLINARSLGAYTYPVRPTRESVLFIGTQFSNLYTAVLTAGSSCLFKAPLAFLSVSLPVILSHAADTLLLPKPLHRRLLLPRFNGKALSRGRCVVNTLVPLFCCSTYYKAVRVGGGDSGGIPSTIKKKNSSVKRDLVYCQKRPNVYPLHYLHYPLHEACAIELTNIDVSKFSFITST